MPLLNVKLVDLLSSEKYNLALRKAIDGTHKHTTEHGFRAWHDTSDQKIKVGPIREGSDTWKGESIGIHSSPIMEKGEIEPRNDMEFRPELEVITHTHFHSDEDPIHRENMPVKPSKSDIRVPDEETMRTKKVDKRNPISGEFEKKVLYWSRRLLSVVIKVPRKGKNVELLFYRLNSPNDETRRWDEIIQKEILDDSDEVERRLASAGVVSISLKKTMKDAALTREDARKIINGLFKTYSPKSKKY